MFDIIKEASSTIPVPMVQPLIGVVAGFLKAADVSSVMIIFSGVLTLLGPSTQRAANNFEWMRWFASTGAQYVVRVAVLSPEEVEERWTQAISALQQ